MTEFSFGVRAYVIFPALIFIWYYGIFFYKLGPEWKINGKWLTSHEVNLRRFTGQRKRLKLFMGYAIGSPILLAILAWLSIGVPAWLAKFSATEPFEREYLYVPGAFIADGYKLRDAITSENASVRPTAALHKKFPDDVSNAYAGKVVCLKGRTSIFGSIVQEIELGRCERVASNAGEPRL